VFIEERLNRILGLVEEKGSVTVRDASEFLSVSADTIRRDFDRLSQKALVYRTHGGIMSKRSVSFDPGIGDKVIQHQDEKEAIARKVAEYVNDGEAIVLDAGTTTERVVKYLADRRDVTIFTDGLNIAVESTSRNIPTIILGGTIRNSTLCVTGPEAVDMIRHYHFDKVIVGVSALSLTRGLMTANAMEAEIKKELMKAANQVIVVADHSKMEKTAFCRFAPVESIGMLVTDRQVDADIVRELEDRGVEVLVAD
jgi:DeoR/GlpR family transcriptional regulator of sugar metabolism